MNKDEVAQLSEEIGKMAEDILLQLQSLQLKPNFVEKFYYALLIRERTILQDISGVLRNNNLKNITSAFILFRVLLDDFIRLFSIYTSSNMEEEIIKLQANSWKHLFITIEESVKINNEFYSGQNPSLFTKEKQDMYMKVIIDDPWYDKYFKNKAELTFKQGPTIAKVFEGLHSKGIRVNSNIHAHVIYKELSEYVHFSNFINPDHSPIRNFEISQASEILLYCYKMVCIQYDFFRKTYNLNWSGKSIPELFGSGMT